MDFGVVIGLILLSVIAILFFILGNVYVGRRIEDGTVRTKVVWQLLFITVSAAITFTGIFFLIGVGLSTTVPGYGEVISLDAISVIAQFLIHFGMIALLFSLPVVLGALWSLLRARSSGNAI